MIFPRQQLYKINFLGYLIEFFKKFFFKDSKQEYEIEKNNLQNIFFEHYGLSEVIPTTAGRVAFYYAVKYSIDNNKNKIIVCPFTIFDMINMIKLAGGKPLFIDSEPFKTNIDIEKLENTIIENKDTAAILITHYHVLDRNFDNVKKLCKKYNLKIIEDCAISIGTKKSFEDSDFVIFSFGIFKFISSFIGGALYIKSHQTRKTINDEINRYEIIKPYEYIFFFLKGLKFKIILNKFFFNIFVFRIIKFGYGNDINFIKNLVKNDPKPFSRKKLDNYMQKRLSPFQMREILKQHSNLQKNKDKRLRNSIIYYEGLQNLKYVVLPESPNKIDDCYLAFPIVLKKKKVFLKKLNNSGFDLSEYFYRNCSNLEIFNEFKNTELKNINYYSNNVLLLPCYPNISIKYIQKLINEIKKIDQSI